MLHDNKQLDLMGACPLGVSPFPPPPPCNNPVPSFSEFNPSSSWVPGAFPRQSLQISTRGRCHQRFGEKGGEEVLAPDSLGQREEVLLSFLESKSQGTTSLDPAQRRARTKSRLEVKYFEIQWGEAKPCFVLLLALGQYAGVPKGLEPERCVVLTAILSPT